MITVLLNSGTSVLPRCSSSKRKPYWNEQVKAARETALFWHWLWKDNGRPREGAVADTMRRTRAQYHYAVRRLRCKNLELTKCRMAECAANNNTRDLWSETRKLLSVSKSSVNVVHLILKIYVMFLLINMRNYIAVFLQNPKILTIFIED